MYRQELSGAGACQAFGRSGVRGSTHVCACQAFGRSGVRRSSQPRLSGCRAFEGRLQTTSFEKVAGLLCSPSCR